MWQLLLKDVTAILQNGQKFISKYVRPIITKCDSFKKYEDFIAKRDSHFLIRKLKRK